VGKSSLLSTLTETESEAAAYEFTTLTCIPGNIIYNDTKIQLLDLPGEEIRERKEGCAMIECVYVSEGVCVDVFTYPPIHHRRCLRCGGDNRSCPSPPVGGMRYGVGWSVVVCVVVVVAAESKQQNNESMVGGAQAPNQKWGPITHQPTHPTPPVLLLLSF
jgi:hypothetical protein